jgi:peroxiredoxin
VTSTLKFTPIATLLLLFSSATLNVIQAVRSSERTRVHSAALKPGDVAPRFTVRTLDGRPMEIDPAVGPTVLYYFSPTCRWCDRNLLNLKALMAQTDGRYRFVGLSSSSNVANYLRDRRLVLDTFTSVSPEATSQYDLGGTPHTVVIGAGGRITHVWAGAFAGALQPAVERAFNITLPGLLAAPEDQSRDKQ